MILNGDSTKIRSRAILLGDEIGLPILNAVANELGLEILGLSFSKKVTEEMQLKISSELNIPSIHAQISLDRNLVISEFIKKNTIHLVIMFSYDVILDYTIIGTPDLKIINILTKVRITLIF